MKLAMSPDSRCRVNASSTASWRRRSTTAGRRECTCPRARLASWRTAASERSSVVATSAKPSPNTSCSTNATRSNGVSDSSTTSIAIDTESASSTLSAGPRSVATGSGSHGPT